MTGDVGPGGNSRVSTSSTTRAGRSVGSTDASTPVNWIRRNGRPMTISSVAVAIAIGPGRRITVRERRYHGPSWRCAASRCIAARQRFRLSAFTRGPSAASSAGSSVSETNAALSATRLPPTPIEYRKRSGKTSIEAIAAATVSAENSTVRPAVATVARTASAVSRSCSSSSRKRETMNSE